MRTNSNEYDASEHRKTMFAHFGAAFYLLNCFEHGLANALMVADFLSAQRSNIAIKGRQFDRKKYEADFDAFFDRQFAHLNLKMIEAKKRRDFLAHHFFRERALEILTPAGIDKMIAELEADQALFRDVDQELDETLAPKRRELGIRDEWIEEHFERMLQQVSQNDSTKEA